VISSWPHVTRLLSLTVYRRSDILFIIHLPTSFTYTAVELICEHPYNHEGSITTSRYKRINHILSRTNTSQNPGQAPPVVIHTCKALVRVVPLYIAKVSAYLLTDIDLHSHEWLAGRLVGHSLQTDRTAGISPFDSAITRVMPPPDALLRREVISIYKGFTPITLGRESVTECHA
jgi:hypothetical protein